MSEHVWSVLYCYEIISTSLPIPYWIRIKMVSSTFLLSFWCP